MRDLRPYLVSLLFTLKILVLVHFCIHRPSQSTHLCVHMHTYKFYYNWQSPPIYGGLRKGFADDTLIICDTNQEQLVYMNWSFMWFEAISGLKNVDKCELILIEGVENVEALTATLNVGWGNLPATYLGLPSEPLLALLLPLPWVALLAPLFNRSFLYL